MKNILSIISMTFMLSGCGLFGPVKTSFPMPSDSLMAAPRELKTIESADATATMNLGDSTPSGIPLSVVTKIVTDNYTTCNLNKEQLLLLQSWVNDQHKLNP